MRKIRFISKLYDKVFAYKIETFYRIRKLATSYETENPKTKQNTKHSSNAQIRQDNKWNIVLNENTYIRNIEQRMDGIM